MHDFFVVGGGQAEASYIGSVGFDPAGASSKSVTSVPIGTAATDRIVLCVAYLLDSGTRQLVSAATIGGVTASGFLGNNSFTDSLTIFYASVPSGTTATVAMTFTDTVSFPCRLFVFNIKGADDSTYTDYATDSVVTGPTTPLSVNIDIPEDGVVLAFTHQSAGETTYGTWTGVTTLGQSASSELRFNSGKREVGAAETNATVSSSAARILQAISWK